MTTAIRTSKQLTAILVILGLAGCTSFNSRDDGSKPVGEPITIAIPLERGEYQGEKPTEGEAATYCTIMESGSYDIRLKNHAGDVIAVLDRICVNYHETYVKPDPPRPGRHIFASHYTFTVKRSSAKISALYMQSEFFQQTSPTTRLLLTKQGNWTTFSCTANPVSKVVDNVEDLLPPTGAEILRNAHPRGYLHLTYYYGGCN